MSTEYIAHRINTIEELKLLCPEYGVEIDLRDGLDGRIYLQHDPFIPGDDFEEYLQNYEHGTMILNIKSERVELKALELIKKYNIQKYFFLDSSFPMIKLLTDKGERNIAIRFSELEGLENLRLMQGRCDWVWADCFTKFPLTEESYKTIKELGYKICFVSHELEGQAEKIAEYRKLTEIKNISLDAICTKFNNICKWQCLSKDDWY